tara:strand:- start:2110 stop:2361 length:252 start_codon:yes stop_codon:yes gene_type:complete
MGRAATLSPFHFDLLIFIAPDFLEFSSKSSKHDMQSLVLRQCFVLPNRVICVCALLQCDIRIACQPDLLVRHSTTKPITIGEG